MLKAVIHNITYRYVDTYRWFSIESIMFEVFQRLVNLCSICQDIIIVQFEKRA